MKEKRKTTGEVKPATMEEEHKVWAANAEDIVDVSIRKNKYMQIV